MSFEYVEGVGMVHFNMAKAPRVVPGDERHKWNSKPGWGESTKCVRCGCIKRRLRTQPDYTETYQMPGQPVTHTRPACTGSTTK